MSSEQELLYVVLSILGLIVFVVFIVLSFKVSEVLFSSKVINEENASSVLASGATEPWNAFREINRDWRPSLGDEVLMNLGLSGSDFRYADLSKVDFSGSNLTGADFTGSDLSNARLVGANLTNAVFAECTLSGVNFQDAIVEGAIFSSKSELEKIREAAKGTARLVDPNLIPDASSPWYQSAISRIEEGEDALDKLSEEELTNLVGGLLKRDGYSITVGAKVEGQYFDISARQDTPIGEWLVLIEVKRVSSIEKTIGLAPVQSTVGRIYSINQAIAVIATNGRFSESARKFVATRHGVSLLDGTELRRRLLAKPMIS